MVPLACSKIDENDDLDRRRSLSANTCPLKAIAATRMKTQNRHDLGDGGDPVDDAAFDTPQDQVEENDIPTDEAMTAMMVSLPRARGKVGARRRDDQRTEYGIVVSPRTPTPESERRVEADVSPVPPWRRRKYWLRGRACGGEAESMKAIISIPVPAMVQ